MANARWYSPQLRRDLVSRLYHRAKAERIPRTRLACRLLDEALDRTMPSDATALRVAEDSTPPTSPPAPKAARASTTTH